MFWINPAKQISFKALLNFVSLHSSAMDETDLGVFIQLSQSVRAHHE